MLQRHKVMEAFPEGGLDLFLDDGEPFAFELAIPEGSPRALEQIQLEYSLNGSTSFTLCTGKGVTVHDSCLHFEHVGERPAPGAYWHKCILRDQRNGVVNILFVGTVVVSGEARDA